MGLGWGRDRGVWFYDRCAAERRLRQLLRGDVVGFEKCDLVVIVLKKRFIFF